MYVPVYGLIGIEDDTINEKPWISIHENEVVQTGSIGSS